MAQTGTFGSGKLVELVSSWQEQDRQKRELSQSDEVYWLALALALIAAGVGLLAVGSEIGIFFVLIGVFLGAWIVMNPAKPLPNAYLYKAHNFNWWVALGQNPEEVLPVIEETLQMSEVENNLPWERQIIIFSLVRGALWSYQNGKWESELHRRVGTKALEAASKDSARLVVQY